MIILVDDDIDDLELFQEALNDSPYTGQSTQAKNGLELMSVLSIVQPKEVEMIVLDLNMPVKNGFQVLEEVRMNNSMNGIPISVLSASSNKADETRCFELGCRMFIRKPNSMAAYKTLIDRILASISSGRISR